jgi:hypothetical protein
MLRHVDLVRTDVSEELSASFIKVTRIIELGTTLAVTSNRCMLVFLRIVCRLLVTASVVPSSPILVTLVKDALHSTETSVLTRAAWHNIPEDTILHSHCRENLKSYMASVCSLLARLTSSISDQISISWLKLSHVSSMLHCTTYLCLYIVAFMSSIGHTKSAFI